MKRKKDQPSDLFKFANVVPPNAGKFDVLGLSEADIRQLHDGAVPEWIHETVAWWLRDNPKPSDVPPKEHEESLGVGEQRSA